MLQLEPSLRQCTPYKYTPAPPTLLPHHTHTFTPIQFHFSYNVVGKFPKEWCSTWNHSDREFQADLKTNTNSSTFDQADADLKANEKAGGNKCTQIVRRLPDWKQSACFLYSLPGGLIADVFVSVASHSSCCGLNPQSASEIRHSLRGRKGFPQITVLISLRAVASH